MKHVMATFLPISDIPFHTLQKMAKTLDNGDETSDVSVCIIFFKLMKAGIIIVLIITIF